MRLLKLLVVVLVFHLGFGATQCAVSYHAGDVANYGSAGIVSHTPIGTFIDLESPPGSTGEGENPSRFKALLDFANNLGDMIGGLASFGYGFLTDIGPDAGAVYTVVLGFRLISVLIWIALGVALIYFLFDSNLLTSKLGLGLVGLLAGVGGLGGFGAAF